MLRSLTDLLWSVFNSTPVTPSVPIEEEWVAILSECEEEMSRRQRSGVDKDLQTLQVRSTRTTYRDLVKDVQEILTKYPSMENSHLTSDLKLKIFKEVFTNLSPSWLSEWCKFQSDLGIHWYPTAYERNILGELIAISNQFSPNTLTVKGLAQTLMSVHLSLVSSLNTLRKEALTSDECNQILRTLVQTSTEPIIKLWISTVAQSSKTSSRMGKLATEWKTKETQDETNRQKLKGNTDARFGTPESDPIRRKYLQNKAEKTILCETPTSPWFSKEGFKERQSLLQSSLVLRGKTGKERSERSERSETLGKERSERSERSETPGKVASERVRQLELLLRFRSPLHEEIKSIRVEVELIRKEIKKISA